MKALPVVLLIFLACTTISWSDIPKEAYPKWWGASGVVTDDISNDFKPINQGQVKWMATQAYEEIKALWPDGDAAIDGVMATFSNTNNHRPVNIGQLKRVAQPFYDFRSSFGIGDPYPWVEIPGYDDDYAICNGGDLKEFFFWELPSTTNFIYVATNGTGVGTIDDPMGDLKQVLLSEAGQGVSIIVRGGDYRYNLTDTNSYSGQSSTLFNTLRGFNNEMPRLSALHKATGWVNYAGDIWMIEDYGHSVEQLFYQDNCLDVIGHPDYHSSWDHIYRDTYLFDVEDMYPGTFYMDTAIDTLYAYLPDSSEPPDDGLDVCIDYEIFLFNQRVRPGDPTSSDVGRNARYKRMRWVGGGQTPTGFSTIRTGYNTTLWHMDIQWSAGVCLYYYGNSRYLRSNISNMGKGGFVGNGSNNTIVYGCTFTNINYRGYSSGWDTGASKFFSNKSISQGSIFDDCYIANGKGEGLWFDMQNASDYGKTNIVRNCVVENVVIGLISEASSGSLFYNNVVIGNYYGIELNATRDSTVANNTIINTKGAYSIYLRQEDVRNPVTNNVVVNNLIYMDAPGNYAHAFPVQDDHMRDNIVDYNCYYKPGLDTLFYGSTLDQQHLWGREIHSITNNPKLIYPSALGAGLFLGSDSPCIDAGTNLPWLVKDRLGRWRNGVDDIGAYEYVPGDGSDVGYVWGLQRHTIPIDITTIEGRLTSSEDELVASFIASGVTTAVAVVVNERDYTWSVDASTIPEGVSTTIVVENTDTTKPIVAYTTTTIKGGVGTGTPVIDIVVMPDQAESGDVLIQGTVNEHAVGEVYWSIDYGPYYQSNDHVVVSSGSVLPIDGDWSITVPDSTMLEGIHTFSITTTNSVGIAVVASHIFDYGITTDHYADPDSPNPTYPYTTLATAARRAMDACGSAWDGDTVWLADGTYDSGVTFQGSSGFVRSRAEVLRGYTLRSINGPENCIIKGQLRYSGSTLLARYAIRGLHIEHPDANVYGITCAYGEWYAWGGGGMYITAGNIVSNCVFRNNYTRSSTSGGAVSIYSPGDLIFTDNIIRDNTGAAGSAVGLQVNWALSANIKNNEVYGNSGGAAAVKLVNSAANNFLIHDNSCSSALSIGYGSKLYNSTIIDNTTTLGGLWFNNEGSGHTYVYNTIAHNNAFDTTTVNLTGSAAGHLLNCIVDAVDTNLFSDIAGTVVGDPGLTSTYAPIEGSLARDGGTNEYPTVTFDTDFYGNERIQGAAIDIGAVEAVQLFVSTTGSDSNDGTFELPFLTLQHAVDEAPEGGSIIVRGGEYRLTHQVDIEKDNIAIFGYPEERPVIKGSIVQEGWTYTGSNNIWKTDMDWDVNTVLEDDVPLQQIGYPIDYYLPNYDTGEPPEVHLAVVGYTIDDMYPGTFYNSNEVTTLFVRLFGEDSPAGHIMEIPKVTQCIDAMFSSGTILTNLDLGHTDKKGSLVVLGSNSRMEDCRLYNSSYAGLQFHRLHGTDINVSNMVVRNCQFHSLGYGGIGIYYGSDIDISGCSFTNNNRRQWQTNWDVGCIKAIPAYNIDVHHNEFTSNACACVWFDWCRADNAYYDNNYVPIEGGNNNTYNNYFADNGRVDKYNIGMAAIGRTLSRGRHVVYYEVCVGGEAYNNISENDHGAAIAIVDSSNIDYHNNTVIGNTYRPIVTANSNTRPKCGKNTITDNFFHSILTDGAVYFMSVSEEIALNFETTGGMISNNVVQIEGDAPRYLFRYDMDGGTSYFATVGDAVAAWGPSIHNIEANGDLDGFTPTIASPLIDASHGTFGLTTDYYGNPRDGSADIGAVEYIP